MLPPRCSLAYRQFLVAAHHMTICFIMMSNHPALAVLEFQQGQLPTALEFFKRTRSELSTLRKCRVWTDKVQAFDVNGNYFEIYGLGYVDKDVVPLLQSINTVFKPDQIHNPISKPYKEFKTGRRYPWAQDRVM